MRVLRLAGLTITTVGLVAFVGAAIAAASLGQVFFRPVWISGVFLICLGCLLLVGFLAVTYREGPRAAAEATMGFLCLLVSMFFLFALFGDEAGFQVQWLLPTVILLPGAFAIVALAALAKREGERWRNRGNE
jgi:hypothetical protein